jgi:hypothetical protein
MEAAFVGLRQQAGALDGHATHLDVGNGGSDLDERLGVTSPQRSHAASP